MSDDNSDEDNDPLNCKFNTLNIYCDKKRVRTCAEKRHAAGFCFLRYKIWHSLLL